MRISADWKDNTIGPDSTIRDALAAINSNLRRIALVMDHERRLIGTVTDGDIRRALLKQMDLSVCISDLLNDKLEVNRKPKTAPLGTATSELKNIMLAHGINQIPLLDQAGHVCDLVVLSDLEDEGELPVKAVIMAGGYGKRLHPLTEHMPKPMLQIGKKPIMQMIIEKLASAGIKDITVSTHFMPEKIKDHFGDGTALGVRISYVHESEPLGTAGVLTLMDNPNCPFLVINGDILTDVDFKTLYEFHREHHAMLTVSVRKYDFLVPYGVVEGDGEKVKSLVEKPSYSFFVNAGIYLVEAKAYDYIEVNKKMDMTDLINRLLEEKREVVNFPIHEYWLDIGQHAQYEKAQQDVKNGVFNG